MNQQTEDLTPQEKKACECLLKENWPLLYPDFSGRSKADDTTNTIDSPTKFLKTLDGSPRVTNHSMRSRYISDCSWISPTTVSVEQLFSKCSNVMKCDRRKMHPRIFEAIVFLKENESWWDVNLVQQMIAKHYDEELNEEYEDMEDDDNWEF